MAERYNKLADAQVLIFGGSSGIGFAIAEASLASSAKVTISSSRTSTTETAVSKPKTSFPNGSIRGVPCDLSDPRGLEERLEALFHTSNTKFDHIVYTSGDTHHPTSIDKISQESILACGQVRYLSALLMIKIAAAKYITPGPSSSITLSNGCVFERPTEGWVPEIGWAGAVHSAVRALAVDLRPIRVNCMSLGAFDTPLLDSSFPGHVDAVKKGIAGKILTGEVGRAEDVAEGYLGFMRNRNVTGATLVSDGGQRFV